MADPPSTNQLEYAPLLSGPYNIDDVIKERENTSTVCRTKLRAKTTERIVELVYGMVEDLGFTKEHVICMLESLASQSIDTFKFENFGEQEISAERISLAQLLVIRLYTSSELSKTYGIELAQILRLTLRDRKTEVVTKLRPFIRTLDDALVRLPRYESEEALFRGESVKIKYLEPGMEFHTAYFTSFSLDMYEALPFTIRQTGTLFVLQKPKSGADIAFASALQGEMEVLYPRNTHFKVLHVFSGAEARVHVPELKKTFLTEQLTVIVITEV